MSLFFWWKLVTFWNQAQRKLCSLCCTMCRTRRALLHFASLNFERWVLPHMVIVMNANIIMIITITLTMMFLITTMRQNCLHDRNINISPRVFSSKRFSPEQSRLPSSSQNLTSVQFSSQLSKAFPITEPGDNNVYWCLLLCHAWFVFVLMLFAVWVVALHIWNQFCILLLAVRSLAFIYVTIVLIICRYIVDNIFGAVILEDESEAKKDDDKKYKKITFRQVVPSAPGAEGLSKKNQEVTFSLFLDNPDCSKILVFESGLNSHKLLIVTIFHSIPKSAPYTFQPLPFSLLPHQKYTKNVCSFLLAFLIRRHRARVWDVWPAYDETRWTAGKSHFWHIAAWFVLFQ